MRKRAKKRKRGKLYLLHLRLCFNKNTVDNAVVDECSMKEADPGLHTLMLTRPNTANSVGYWVITLWRGCGGQCLAQGHFSSCSWGREENYILGLSRSGISQKLFNSDLFFISRRSNVQHYVKSLIQHKQCWWVSFPQVSSLIRFVNLAACHKFQERQVNKIKLIVI